MASQQPPARSWFRLASIARMEAAEAAAAAATARASATSPLIPRTTIPTPQPPPPPPPPPPPQPPALQPPPPPPLSPTPQAEPQPKLPVTPTPTEAAAPPPSPNEPQRPPTPLPRPPTPPESPKVIKPLYSSPNANPEPEPEIKLPPPPPPAPEEKSITSSNGSKANTGAPTKEEKQRGVITMAGENTGAVMDIGSAAPRRLGHKMDQEHGDGKKGGKPATKTKHMEAVVNSNVQGINNSIVFNSSTTQHSPGVHITFASNRKPKGSDSSSSYKAHHSDHLH